MTAKKFTKTGKYFGGGEFFWLARIYTPACNTIDTMNSYFLCSSKKLLHSVFAVLLAVLAVRGGPFNNLSVKVINAKSLLGSDLNSRFNQTKKTKQKTEI